MARPPQTATFRFDAPAGVVYAAALDAIRAGTVNARLVSDDRILGAIVIRLALSALHPGERVVLRVGAIDRATAEIAFEPRKRSVLPRGRRERAFAYIATAIEIAVHHARSRELDADQDIVIDLTAYEGTRGARRRDRTRTDRRTAATVTSRVTASLTLKDRPHRQPARPPTDRPRGWNVSVAAADRGTRCGTTPERRSRT